MHKNTTLSENINSEVHLCDKNSCLQPSKNTLNKILQFAATYRTTKATDNSIIDICLN